MARRSLERADLALVVLDAAEGVTTQDARIAGYAEAAGRAVVLVVNKWDLIGTADRAPDLVRGLRERLPFLAHAPVVFTSARSGSGLRRALRDDRSGRARLREGDLDRRAEPRAERGARTTAPRGRAREDAQGLLRHADRHAAAHVPPVRQRPGGAPLLLRALSRERAPRAVRAGRVSGAAPATPAASDAHAARDVRRGRAVASPCCSSAARRLNRPVTPDRGAAQRPGGRLLPARRPRRAPLSSSSARRPSGPAGRAPWRTSGTRGSRSATSPARSRHTSARWRPRPTIPGRRTTSHGRSFKIPRGGGRPSRSSTGRSQSRPSRAGTTSTRWAPCASARETIRRRSMRSARRSPTRRFATGARAPRAGSRRRGARPPRRSDGAAHCRTLAETERAGARPGDVSAVGGLGSVC